MKNVTLRKTSVDLLFTICNKSEQTKFADIDRNKTVYA